MSFYMEPQSSAGQKFVDAATKVVPTLRQNADLADRSGTIQRESFQALQDNGVAAAFVPEELGGLGLTSIHDWLAGLSTLGRGDGSVAIAINMHLGVSRGMSQAYLAAAAQGHNTDGLSKPLRAIAAGKMLICATATERGTDNLHPNTVASADGDAWCINGTKMFVTMSPIATHIGMNLRMQDDDSDQLATTLFPMDTPGIEPQHDWDALGMRASGSQSIKFNDVRVPKSSVRPLGPWGEWSTNVLINRTVGNLPLVAAFLGIAEHAYEVTMQSLPKQQRLNEPLQTHHGVQQLVGEMTIELAKCQSILTRAGSIADEFFARHQHERPSMEAAHQLMADYQCAKACVNQGAIDIVSKAMDLSGGGGYMSGNTLTRLYRDVRAGPFMQPFGTTELASYVGQVALGLYPAS